MVLQLAAALAPAQEALLTAVQGDQSYRTRTAADYRPSERLKAGPVYFDIGLNDSQEWNDNIRYTNSNPQSDFIQRPLLNVKAVWPAMKDSTLSFGTGIGYEAYFDHSDLDQMLITPDSELAWDIPVKDFVFTIYDRFLYSQDVISQPALSGTATYPRVENTAGLRSRWMPAQYQFELGYAHYNFIAESSTYDYLNRASEQFFGRAAYRFAEATQAGLEASGSLTTYEMSVQQNNQSVSVGPYLEWQLLASLRLSLRGGCVAYFQDSSPSVPQSSTLTSYYLGLEADQQLTDHLHYHLSVTRDVQPGVNQGSDVTEQWNVAYSVAWAFRNNWTLTPSVTYNHGNPSSYGVNQTYDQVGLGAGVNWQMLRHLSVGLAYRYTTKTCDLATQDYNQNVVTLSGKYQF